MDTDDLLTTRKAAAVLGISIRHVSRLGIEPVVKLDGTRGAALWSRDDIERLAREREQEPAA